MSNNALMWTIIVIVLIAGGYFILINGEPPGDSENDEEQINQEPQEATTDPTSDTESPTDQTGAEEPETTDATSQSDTSETEAETHTVVYADSGYLPETLRIDVGDTVMWLNENSEPMWTASDVHPVHAEFSGTSLSEHCPDPDNTAFDACASVEIGGSWSFTFSKAGTWNYHNHLSPGHTGTVVVE